MLLRYLISVFFLISSPCVLGALTPDEQAAKKQGLIFFNQLKAVSAIPYLEKAAVAGDVESQYFLGEALRKRGRYITREAYHWYEMAASQGDYYAMVRLADSDNEICAILHDCPVGYKKAGEWLEEVQKQAARSAEAGDAEAMVIMYYVSGDRRWLERAAEHGYAIAQYWMALSEEQGEGFFITERRRRASVEKWFKRSAEGGYPKAMMSYVVILHEKGDFESARRWIIEAAKSGFKSGVSSYGAYLGHAPARFDFPLDLVKGYGLTYLLRELDGGGNVQVYVDEVLEEIGSKMNSSQIEQAKIFAEEWKANHPPLSFFPDKLGY